MIYSKLLRGMETGVCHQLCGPCSSSAVFLNLKGQGVHFSAFESENSYGGLVTCILSNIQPLRTLKMVSNLTYFLKFSRPGVCPSIPLA